MNRFSFSLEMKPLRRDAFLASLSPQGAEQSLYLSELNCERYFCSSRVPSSQLVCNSALEATAEEEARATPTRKCRGSVELKPWLHVINQKVLRSLIHRHTEARSCHKQWNSITISEPKMRFIKPQLTVYSWAQLESHLWDSPEFVIIARLESERIRDPGNPPETPTHS